MYPWWGRPYWGLVLVIDHQMNSLDRGSTFILTQSRAGHQPVNLRVLVDMVEVADIAGLYRCDRIRIMVLIIDGHNLIPHLPDVSIFQILTTK
jgi:hypothetical protein